jgi:hypothetical protein
LFLLLSVAFKSVGIALLLIVAVLGVGVVWLTALLLSAVVNGVGVNGLGFLTVTFGYVAWVLTVLFIAAEACGVKCERGCLWCSYF